MTSELIECPFCAELIKVKAKKCRHCGEFLEQGLTQEAVLTEFQERKEALVEEPAPEDAAPAAPVAAPADAALPVQAHAQEGEPAPQGPVVVIEADEAGAQGEDPLGGLYEKLMDMPDSPEREMVIQTLEQLATETQKGQEAEEGKVESMVKTVVQVLPDVAEVTINTMINPASGLLTLVQKVAQRVAGSQSEEKEEPAQEEDKGEQDTPADDPVQVDTEAAAEALEQVHEQLSDQPDSPEKELVEEALERLETDTDETEGSDKDGEDLGDKVAEVIGDVAEALPDVAEAAVEVAAVVAKNAAKGSDKK